jgi:hypothetical protein
MIDHRSRGTIYEAVCESHLREQVAKAYILRILFPSGKPEVIPRRESAPVHLILRRNIPGALGDT